MAVETLFTDQTPANSILNDDNGITLGVRVVPAIDGEISGVRWWRPDGDSGDPTKVRGLIYQDGLATANKVIAGMTASGWQNVMFDTPVPVAEGVEFIAAVYSTGDYAYTSAVMPFSNGESLAAAGSLYRYSGGEPNVPNNASAANYFVDVFFETEEPPVEEEDGFPVVVVESGGIAVTVVTEGAPAAVVAADGVGIAITIVEQGGMPLVVYGLDD